MAYKFYSVLPFVTITSDRIRNIGCTFSFMYNGSVKLYKYGIGWRVFRNQKYNNHF